MTKTEALCTLLQHMSALEINSEDYKNLRPIVYSIKNNIFPFLHKRYVSINLSELGIVLTDLSFDINVDITNLFERFFTEKFNSESVFEQITNYIDENYEYRNITDSDTQFIIEYVYLSLFATELIEKINITVENSSFTYSQVLIRYRDDLDSWFNNWVDDTQERYCNNNNNYQNKY